MSDRSVPGRAYVETYGCQMNISDGELMEGILEAGGWTIVGAPEEADVVLVNTCAIRDHAERRVLGRVGQLKGLRDENPELVIGVTGCMAQRLGSDLLEKAPHVDLVMGPDGYRDLCDHLGAIRGGPGAAGSGPSGGASPDPSSGPSSRRSAVTGRARKRRIPLSVLDLDLDENYQGLEQRRTSAISAWVPIQRGCDHRCTYCIVPYVRGPEKNRAAREVLEEVASLAAGGVTEVNLLGQTVNSYRSDTWSFPRLLRAVARTDGIRRVRFLSPHPNDVTEELVRVMADEASVCEHLHLPLQAGSDRTLKRMLRRHTVAEYLEKVDMLRTAIPDLAITTDLIVAFPGETEAEFEATLDVVRTVRFDDAFTYRFSPRDGTPATRLPASDTVSDEEGQRRLERLIEVARGIQSEISATEVGRVEEVLVEKEGRYDGTLLGRTRRGKAVAFPGDPASIGTYLTVRLDDTTGATFMGSEVSALEPARTA